MGVKKETITPGDGQNGSLHRWYYPRTFYMKDSDGVDTKSANGTTYPKKGQMVVVHYTGTIAGTGVVFDSSRERNNPFKFKLGSGEVIKGWEEGISKMSTGERAQLTCSPDFAFGSRGFPGVIPSNATLIFDVELLKLE